MSSRELTLRLGTWTSQAGRLSAARQPLLVPDRRQETRLSTPSAVRFSAEALLIGHAADFPLEHEPYAQRLFPLAALYGCQSGTDRDSSIAVAERRLLIASLMRKLADDFAAHAGFSAERLRLVFPPWLDDEQRAELVQAAQLAGATSLALVDESLAIRAYYQDQLPRSAMRVAVLHVGARCCWVALLELIDRTWQLRYVSSERDLGGMTVDALVAEFLALQCGQDRNSGAEPHTELLHHGEEIKRQMQADTTIRTALLVDHRVHSVVLPTALLETPAQLITNRIVDKIERTLLQFGWDARQLAALLVAGGAVHFPPLAAALRVWGEAQRVPMLLHRPELAAIFGGTLLVDPGITPFSSADRVSSPTRQIGLLARSSNEAAPQWTPLFDLRAADKPAGQRRLFIGGDHQRRLVLELASDENDPPRLLGRLVLDLREARSGDPVELHWQLAAPTELRLTARDLRSGSETSVTCRLPPASGELPATSLTQLLEKRVVVS